MSVLMNIILADSPDKRNSSLDEFCRSASLDALVHEADALEEFRFTSPSLYEQVRALFFLYAIHRFHIPSRAKAATRTLIPFEAFEDLLHRRFEEAIQRLLALQRQEGASEGISSALASAYRGLGFQTLANQVRASVRAVRGNQWMFRTGHPSDHPLRIVKDLTKARDGVYPIVHETTPVRMDLSHSAWSDIFFLGMDYPEGAKVLNISVDLAVRDEGQEAAPRPPVEAFVRVIDRPLIRLVSTDLNTSAEITTFPQIFDFAADYLGLLKAAVIASGIVPPGMEGASQTLAELLSVLVGPGLGLEIVSQVNGIPKGSRLAVSTTLLSCIIAACMRATGQVGSLTGGLTEPERRTIAARAILGEWLGGSGGGWQDSGGVWPGIKIIEGVPSTEEDIEFGTSRGCLLPRHTILGQDEVSEATRAMLQDSLVLVHGGMAQDVGPILEMVTERYLLRSEAEWTARLKALRLFEEITGCLRRGEVKALGKATHENFAGPIATIIPWATNRYTESIIARVQSAFGADFWGFWMLGGMSGGGMGFLFDPKRKTEAVNALQEIMHEEKRRFMDGIPFAMEPVVYDFRINEQGSAAGLLEGPEAVLPAQYYALTIPPLLQRDPRSITPDQRQELERFAMLSRSSTGSTALLQRIIERILPEANGHRPEQTSLAQLLEKHGFDRTQHEHIRADLHAGLVGLAQNRLPVSTTIRDVAAGDVHCMDEREAGRLKDVGMRALAHGEVAVLTLAAGAGSRWTKGAGTVKALNPFCRMAGRHRTFLDVHLAKTRATMTTCKAPLTHVVATGYLTHAPLERYLADEMTDRSGVRAVLSPGTSIGLRLIPTLRDLRFAWQELPQQLLDEQAQKVLDSARAALMEWAQQSGEGNDYTDNLPLQCVNPVGHWYEIPNLLRNGVLAALLQETPSLKYLMVHNIDTLGANVDPSILGHHIVKGAGMTVEVISRWLDDRGGGLAREGGRLRLIEGLALPREQEEFSLTYYNSATYWIDIDQLLKVFGLQRKDLGDEYRVAVAVRSVAARMPTYVTLKNVKKRWGKGQEDIFPTLQYEKLWGDMTALPELSCTYLEVPRLRGQQLKEPAQMDGWLRDGSAAYVEGLCEWNDGASKV